MIKVVPAIKGFTISFDPSTELDIGGYVVHASQVNNFTPDGNNLVSVGPDTVVTCQVPYSGTVYVKVAAYDSFEDPTNINFNGLNYSTQQTVVVTSNNPLDMTPPAVPTGLSVTAEVDVVGQADTCNANVSWVAVADTDLDLIGYIVQLRKNSETVFSEFQTSTNSYKITGLVPSTTYAVRVASLDRWGNLSDYTAWADASTGKDTTLPDVPTSVTISAGFDTVSVIIAGATNTDFDHYEIQLATNSSFTGPTSVTTSASISTVRVGEGATYWVRVRSVDRSGNVSSTWKSSSPASVTTALVLPSALYNELRTDFLINNVLFKFGRTGDTTYPTDTSLYVVSTSGNIVWKNKTYTITNGTTTLAGAVNKYVKATCNTTDNTAALSLIDTTVDLTSVLASNEIILAVTSPAKQPDSNGNYICYVRNGNSLEIEGALIRTATISTAQIKSLNVGDAVVTGTLRADQIGANLITADKIATGVTGNICSGKGVTGTGGASTVPTDGVKDVNAYFIFGSGASNNNSAESSYFEVDLGSIRKVGQVNLFFLTFTNRHYWYKVKYSTDGSTWSYMAGTSANTGWALSTDNISQSPLPTVVRPPSICQARYIRVYGNGNTYDGWNQIIEVEAFEYGTLISGDQISSGTISADTYISVGDSKVVIDGKGQKISVSDGTRERVTIGKLASGYGIDIKNSSGVTVFDANGDIEGTRVNGNLNVTGNQVVGGSMTAVTIQTDSGAAGHYKRAILSSTNNRLEFHDASDNLVVAVGESTATTQNGGTTNIMVDSPSTTSGTAVAFKKAAGFALICQTGSNASVASTAIAALAPLGNGSIVFGGIANGKTIGVSACGYTAGSFTGDSADINDGIGVYASGYTGVYGAGNYLGGHFTGTKGVLSIGNYYPFTGSHDGLLRKTEATPEVGDILCDNSIVYHSGVSDCMAEFTVSTRAKQKNVIGVFIFKEKFEQDFVAPGLRVSSPDADIPDYDFIEETYDVASINALGEGQINVCKDGGNIEAGDYICSSDRAGKGMKQDDDLHHNYTVAKAREACVWEDGDDSIKMIACTYHCG